MKAFKQILFLQFTMMFICALGHLGSVFLNEPFSFWIYPIMASTIFGLLIIFRYILLPLSEWFLD